MAVKKLYGGAPAEVKQIMKCFIYFFYTADYAISFAIVYNSYRPIMLVKLSACNNSAGSAEVHRYD